LFIYFTSVPAGTEGQRKKRPKNSKKRPKNTTIKPLSTISLPCMKIQGWGHDPPPAADAHDWYMSFSNRIWIKFHLKKTYCVCIPPDELTLFVYSFAPA